MQNDSLRRLMRRIALGLPFAVPVITAPFNVGGCYPIGYQCPTEPVPVVVEHVVEEGVPLDCATICGGEIECAAVDEGHVQCTMHQVRCPPAGRRPAGGVRTAAAPRSPTAGWLHRVAALEAASVVAFEELAADLRALGAPEALVARALEARDDEVRHAHAVASLAARRGGSPLRIEVRRSPRRSLLALAEDNAAEGCVREAWGALEAAVQARTARAPDVREAMAVIARDEARHALLSFDLDAWARRGLDAEGRRQVDEAADGARRALRDDLARRAPIDELGLLPRGAALDAFDRVMA